MWGELRIIITSSLIADIKNKVAKLFMYIYTYFMFAGKMFIRRSVNIYQPKTAKIE